MFFFRNVSTILTFPSIGSVYYGDAQAGLRGRDRFDELGVRESGLRLRARTLWRHPVVSVSVERRLRDVGKAVGPGHELGHGQRHVVVSAGIAPDWEAEYDLQQVWALGRVAAYGPGRQPPSR